MLEKNIPPIVPAIVVAIISARKCNVDNKHDYFTESLYFGS